MLIIFFGSKQMISLPFYSIFTIFSSLRFPFSRLFLLFLFYPYLSFLLFSFRLISSTDWLYSSHPNWFEWTKSNPRRILGERKTLQLKGEKEGREKERENGGRERKAEAEEGWERSLAKKEREAGERERRERSSEHDVECLGFVYQQQQKKQKRRETLYR